MVNEIPNDLIIEKKGFIKPFNDFNSDVKEILSNNTDYGKNTTERQFLLIQRDYIKFIMVFSAIFIIMTFI